MLKRLFDVLIAFLLIVIFSPVLAIVSVSILFTMGQPIFFVQTRPGKHGKPFRMIKFRTMLNTSDKNGNLLSDETRLTAYGKVLRKYSIDELPELFNVLRGEMSLVGPRPLLMEYLNYYTTTQARRHEMLPGITGWSQVNGRNSISWNSKFLLDVWYVDNYSFLLDLKILWLTFMHLLAPSGVNKQGCATMSKFLGNENEE